MIEILAVVLGVLVGIPIIFFFLVGVVALWEMMLEFVGVL